LESQIRPVGLTVIETLGWDGAKAVRLDLHMARAARTCAAFGFDFDANHAAALLTKGWDQPMRLRLTVDEGGSVVVAANMTPAKPLWRIGIAKEQVRRDDQWLRVKTSERQLYDRVRAEMPQGFDEMIFVNQLGHVTEGTITNLFFDNGDGLCTPPLSDGLLPGVLRQELLDLGKCRQRSLPLRDLPKARLWVGNSLRGLIAATMV
jgi:4-amino-4-deoxychorismate lyase